MRRMQKADGLFLAFGMRRPSGLDGFAQKTKGIRHAFMLNGFGVEMKNTKHKLNHRAHHQHVDNASNAQKPSH